MAGIKGSPIDSPRGLCVVLILAIYLLFQCAVNYTTFRDSCNEDTRWSMFFNIVNTAMAGALIIFVCAKIVKQPPGMLPVSSVSDVPGMDNSLFS